MKKVLFIVGLVLIFISNNIRAYENISLYDYGHWDSNYLSRNHDTYTPIIVKPISHSINCDSKKQFKEDVKKLYQYIEANEHFLHFSEHFWGATWYEKEFKKFYNLDYRPSRGVIGIILASEFIINLANRNALIKKDNVCNFNFTNGLANLENSKFNKEIKKEMVKNLNNLLSKLPTNLEYQQVYLSKKVVIKSFNLLDYLLEKEDKNSFNFGSVEIINTLYDFSTVDKKSNSSSQIASNNKAKEAEEKRIAEAKKEEAKKAKEKEDEKRIAAAKKKEEEAKKAQEDEELFIIGSGTGFFVNDDGYIATNEHVAGICQMMASIINGEPYQFKILVTDKLNDLALLKGDYKNNNYLSINSSGADFGEDIVAFGYPLSEQLSSSVKLTRGIVSSLSGPGNNIAQIQIDAAIQPGNSGGPVLNYSGQVIGVASSGLNKVAMLANEDAPYIPENVNFAVAAPTLSSFLKANKVKIYNETIIITNTKELAKVGMPSTIQLFCLNTKTAHQNYKNNEQYNDVLLKKVMEFK